jgi:hypothetical protein
MTFNQNEFGINKRIYESSGDDDDRAFPKARNFTQVVENIKPVRKKINRQKQISENFVCAFCKPKKTFVGKSFFDLHVKSVHPSDLKILPAHINRVLDEIYHQYGNLHEVDFQLLVLLLKIYTSKNDDDDDDDDDDRVNVKNVSAWFNNHIKTLSLEAQSQINHNPIIQLTEECIKEIIDNCKRVDD